MRNGLCFERPTLERPTAESDSSFWPTPKVATGAYSYSSGDHEKPVLNLEGAAKLWPTPTANDDNKSPEAHLRMKQRMGERDGTHANRTQITSLTVMVKAWPIAGRLAPRMKLGGASTSPGVALNPLFVEALMGLPIGWTDSGV